MIQKIKKPISILLSVLMVLSVFAAVPMTAGAATVSYVKVTTAPDDWSGDYLIVFEDEEGNKAFNGSADELDSSGNYIDVTISGGEIESNAATDAAKVTIAQIDGGYSIATATGAYMGGVSGQNELDFRDEAILNTISLEDDSAKIVSNTSTLRFNTTWDGFRYYKTVSQKPVQLYKLTGGSAPTTYTVTWKNDDGTTLETDTDVEEGATPTYDGETPVKPEDENYIYTFSGWTPAIAPVTEDATYTATFTSTEKKYIDANGEEQTFDNYTKVTDSTTLLTEGWYVVTDTVTINSVITCTGDVHLILCNGAELNATALTVQDNNNNLTIYGQSGNNGVLNVSPTSGPAIGARSSGKNTGIITINGGTINATTNGSNVAIGSNDDYNRCGNAYITINGGIVTVTSQSGSEYNRLIGAGHSGSLNESAGGYLRINGGKVVANGVVGGGTDFETSFGWTNVDDSITVNYVSGGSRTLTKPFNDGTNGYAAGSYTWQEFDAFSAKTIYPAASVTWKNDDGTDIETTYVKYGEAPTHADPTKADNAQYTYTFSGWTPAIAPVTEDATYTATFTPKDIFVISNGVLTAYNGDKSALKNLTIPEEVTEIGGSVFKNCTNLESVNLNNVVKVEGDAFFGCTKLSSVIGSKLKYVGYRSFCTTTASLRTLTLRSGNNGADKKGTDSMFVTTAMVDAGNPTWYFYTVVRKGDDGNDFHYTAFNQTFLVEKGVEPFIESDYEEQQTSASGVNKSAIIYITIDDENKTIKVKSNESNVSGYEPGTKILVDGVEYTIVEDIKYTVTWKNEDGTVLKTDENVEEGATPEYNGETPTKPEDAQYVYTFSGWTDGTTAYAPGDAFPAATADAEYTATFTAVKKHVFAAHSISLGGDIGVNFYVDPAVAGVDAANAESATVKFSFDKHTFTVNLKEIKPDENGWYKVTCNIPAAYMAHKIHAEVYIDGEKLDETDDYSVQDYAETILADPAKYDSEKPEKLAVLVKEMLNYGAKAQTVFSGQMNAAAEYDEIEGYSMADVTAEMIQAAIDSNPANEGKTASDMSTVQPESGAQYRTTSLVFLSQSTLRHYFAVPGGSADPSAYDGNQQNYYYYVEKTNISAKELDDLQEFTVNGVTFYYSALDYAKAVVESNMADSAKDLAKSLYLYNQAANAYFDEPADTSPALAGVKETGAVFELDFTQDAGNRNNLFVYKVENKGEEGFVCTYVTQNGKDETAMFGEYAAASIDGDVFEFKYSLNGHSYDVYRFNINEDTYTFTDVFETQMTAIKLNDKDVTSRLYVLK